MWLMLTSPLQAEMWFLLGLHRSFALCYNHCETFFLPMFPCHLTPMALTFFLLPFPWSLGGSKYDTDGIFRAENSEVSYSLYLARELQERGEHYQNTLYSSILTAVFFTIGKFETTEMFINWWMDNENSTFTQWNILQLLRKMKL